jgi:TonB family protein
MIFRFLLILYILIPAWANSQMIIDTVYFDSDWEQSDKEGARYYRVISTDTSGEFRFMVRDYYLSGQIQMAGTYKSIRPDNRDGNFTYYFENGNIQIECIYDDNVLDGPFNEWYESGQQKVSQAFMDGELDGAYTSWREDGTYMLQATYSEGERNGYFISYYENGQKVRNDLYENDILIDGKCFTPEGDPTEYFPYVKMPDFQGGRSGLLKFIRNELKYPSDARRRGYEGSVIVLFTVDKEGNVQDAQIINGDIRSFNQEALRVARAMPKWIPGELDGVPSPMQVTIPIEFTIR